jgi:hypothetical protein
VSVNGSGNIRLINGIQTSKDIEFHINGSGNIQGEGFNCQKMAVSINGSGDVRLQQLESQYVRQVFPVRAISSERQSHSSELFY